MRTFRSKEHARGQNKWRKRDSTRPKKRQHKAKKRLMWQKSEVCCKKIPSYPGHHCDPSKFRSRSSRLADRGFNLLVDRVDNEMIKNLGLGISISGSLAIITEYCGSEPESLSSGHPGGAK